MIILALVAILQTTLFWKRTVIFGLSIHFSPREFWKSGPNSLKFSANLVLYEACIISKNNDYCIIFALVGLLQGKAFLENFLNFNSNVSPEDDVIMKNSYLNILKKLLVHFKYVIGFDAAIKRKAKRTPLFDGEKSNFF